MPVTYPAIISSFDSRVEAALAQLDTADDALRLLDDSADGKRARAQIRREMAESPAKAMVNLALRRQRETGEEGTSIVKPLLVAMGYPAALIDAHLPEAQRLYAQSVMASQKVLERVEDQSSQSEPVAPEEPDGDFSCLTVRIRKDDWIPSRKWHADLTADDGTKDGFTIRGWITACRTKQLVLDLIDIGATNARIIDHDGTVLREWPGDIETASHS